jgi:hypothetical protein
MPDASKPTTKDAAPADERPTADQRAIEKARVEQRDTLDAHEAAAYARAHGEPVKGD